MEAPDLVRRIVHILEKLPFASFQLLNERVDLWADLQSQGLGIHFYTQVSPE